MFDNVKRSMAALFQPKSNPLGTDDRQRNNLMHQIHQLSLFEYWIYCRDCEAGHDWPVPPPSPRDEAYFSSYSLDQLQEMLVRHQNSILSYEDVPESILAHAYMPQTPRTKVARELAAARYRVWRLEVMNYWLYCRDSEHVHQDLPDPPLRRESGNDTVERLTRLAKQYTFQIFQYKDIPDRIRNSEHLLP